MRKCKNCGKEVNSTDKFCPACGSPLQSQKKDREPDRKPGKRNRVLMISVLCCCLCIGGSAAWGYTNGFFAPSQQEKPERLLKDNEEYQAMMSQAKQAMENRDYQTAELLSLDAQKLEPQEPDPFAGLYESYLARDRQDEADQITEQAEQTLSAEQFAVYEELLEEIEEAYEPVNSYTVLRDLGEMDSAPVYAGSRAWLIQQNGEYSIMDADGDVVVGYTDPYVTVSILGNIVNNEWRMDPLDIRTCFSEGFWLTTDSKQWPKPSKNVSNACGPFGIVGPQPVYELNEDNYPTLSEEAASQIALAGGDVTGSIFYPIYLQKQGSRDDSFYIYNPASRQVIGPYKKGDEPGFALMIPRKNGEASPESDTISLFTASQHLFSPFWSKESVKGKDSYTVYSLDGSESLEGFDLAVAVDPMSIGVFENGRYSLLSQDLETQYTGRFEAGSTPVDSRALVKMDGTWKLVEFGKPVRIRNYQGETAPLKEVALPGEVVGSFTLLTDSADTESSLVIKQDGTFSFTYQGDSEDGGEADQLVCHGYLKPDKNSSGRRISLSVAQVEYDSDADTDQQRKVLRAGSVLRFFPAGTSMSQLTTERQRLLASVQNGQKNTEQPVLILDSLKGVYVFN